MWHGAIEVQKVMKNTKRDNMGSITEYTSKRHQGKRKINKNKSVKEGLKGMF